MTSSHKELKSIRAYGLHEQLWVYQNSRSLSRLVRDGPEEVRTNSRYDADFMLDAASIPNASDLASVAAAGYENVRRVVLTNAHSSDPQTTSSLVSYLQFHETDMRETGLGAYQRLDEPRMMLDAEIVGSSNSKRAFVDFVSDIQQRASRFGVPFEVARLIEAHHALGVNYLVSDDPQVHTLRSVYFRDQGHRLIYSSQFYETVERLERRHGMYYIGPNHPIFPKGIYYWRKLHQAIPNFDRLWATALYGVEEGGLDQALLEFAQSLGDRVMSLLQLRDELELLAEDAADMAVEWEMVNKLNYFVVLVTGLFDNIAWLASLRHQIYGTYKPEGARLQVSLRIKKGASGAPKSGLHRDLLQLDGKFYALVDTHQNLLEIFYPVRDSVQHRLVLSGLNTWHMDEGWKRIMVRFAPEAIQALLREEAAQHLTLNGWGVLETRDYGYLVEPMLFCKTATHKVLQFIDDALSILDIPALLAHDQGLQAKVNDQPEELTNLLRKPKYGVSPIRRSSDFRDLGNAGSLGS